ncbi:hypothetical protein L596_005701 [Steinernema carpocapsae]|uniref:Uncharacterized protein n=1 Tax=Steinernema carpocapsae TaxID=34508 RepID=A0A4U8V5A3_STECR|nr:hypothetical protein L596_005701 [Steinernema carpocapsae]
MNETRSMESWATPGCRGARLFPATSTTVAIASGKMSELDGLHKALQLLALNKIDEAEAECTKLLEKNVYDQAAWSLKLQCLTENAFVDELENEEVGLAETFMDNNVISRDARPGTSLARPITTAKGAASRHFVVLRSGW